MFDSYHVSAFMRGLLESGEFHAGEHFNAQTIHSMTDRGSFDDQLGTRLRLLARDAGVALELRVSPDGAEFLSLSGPGLNVEFSIPPVGSSNPDRLPWSDVERAVREAAVLILFSWQVFRPARVPSGMLAGSPLAVLGDAKET